MRELAVDFGTSNTVAGFRAAPGGPTRLVNIDGWPMLPSAVWLSQEGNPVVGRDAERQARLDPSRYEPNPKRRIDDGEVLLGTHVVPVVDLIAAVLRRVAEEARRQLGGEPDVVLLSHPAGWHRLRRETLCAAARAAGWSGTLRLVAEPVAAAAHFAGLEQLHGGLTPGRALAVFDMGGGTTDAAVVLRTENGGWRVLAEAGLGDSGGIDIDQALLEQVRSVVGPDRSEWAELIRPTTSANRRAARTLTDDVRAGKEALSRYAQTDIPLPAPLPDAHVTRAELETLVRPQLDRAVAMLAATITGSRLSPGSLAGVFLVGGASRMPLIARLISERTGVLPTAVESPESSVVLGALALPPGPESAEPGDRPPTRPQAVLPPPGPIPQSPPHGLPQLPLPPTHPQGVPVESAGRMPPNPDAADSFVTVGPTHVMQAPGPRRRAPAPLSIALAVFGVVAAAVAVVVVLVTMQTNRANTTRDVVGDAGLGTEPTQSDGTEVLDDGGSDGSDVPDGGDPDEYDGPTTTTDDVDADGHGAAFGAAAGLLEFAGVAVERADGCENVGDDPALALFVDTAVRCSYVTEDGHFEAYFYQGEACDLIWSGALGEAADTGRWSGAGMTGDWRAQRGAMAPTEHLLYRPDDAGDICGEATHLESEERTSAEVVAFWESTTSPGS
ncbi:Hsp70 family protein [Actinoalloteichus hymeniacidonis]|uniref:Hsp70 protein n=1 Tax=Actinoalloteichus hymeniacidonis TaxID=340345 RepID=A0AAC9HV68_9PSEU|nr:Hsp70 family protein [Actinoalloteichus hymeniacidonis]AOS66023.1 Hsp70 protein [Actinoalloteichus hymeniacidonis]MBB5905875.1 actin-like ATPase involved in cell morphogenesis [Actinoalloteichus hymeniacidonis]